MVALELKLTKQVTADKEGAGPPLPRIVVGIISKVEPRRFYMLSAGIDAHGLVTLEAAQDEQRISRTDQNIDR